MTETLGVAGFAVPTLSEADTSRLGVSQARVLSSEWLKLRSLRSSWVTMAVAILSVPVVGIGIAWSTANDWQHMRVREQFRFNPLADPLSGFNLAQLAVGVLGVLISAGEYPGGMIRASLAAVPTRLPMLWGKVAVFTSVALVTMLPTAVVTFFVSQRILSAQHIQTSWDAPNVARSVIGIGLYLTVVAALAVGLGTMIRNVAGGIGVFVGVILVVPVIASALPQTWGDRIDKWLPSNAGQALMSFGSDNTTLSPWRGFVVFCLYAVATVAIAAFLLRRRDA